MIIFHKTRSIRDLRAQGCCRPAPQKIKLTSTLSRRFIFSLFIRRTRFRYKLYRRRLAWKPGERIDIVLFHCVILIDHRNIKRAFQTKRYYYPSNQQTLWQNKSVGLICIIRSRRILIHVFFLRLDYFLFRNCELDEFTFNPGAVRRRCRMFGRGCVRL